MHPAAIAADAPERPAIIMGSSGATTTFAELDARSNQLAHVIRAAGLGPGGSLAIFAENHPRFLEVTWAAQRAGLSYTAINSHLTADEAAYIIDDCDASIVVSSARLASVATAACTTITTPKVRMRLMLGATPSAPGDAWTSYEALVDKTVDDPDRRRVRGRLHAVLLGHDRSSERHPA